MFSVAASGFRVSEGLAAAGLRTRGKFDMAQDFMALIIRIVVFREFFEPNVMMIKTIVLNNVVVFPISDVFKLRVPRMDDHRIFVAHRHHRRRRFLAQCVPFESLWIELLLPLA